jgi:DNA-binding GntR family transcriptional regulator
MHQRVASQDSSGRATEGLLARDCDHVELADGRPQADRDGAETARRAYAQLRAAILEGVLEPGVAFSQVRLAEELGISRTPLREALRLLQMEGLVHSEYNRQVTVAPLHVGTCESLYAMRIALEPLAVRLTVSKLTQSDRVEISAHLDVLTSASDDSEYSSARDAHRRFHLGLTQHAGEPLSARVGDLWDHAERFRLLYNRQAAGDLAVQRLAGAEHQAIFDAAHRGDGDLAARLVADHLGRIVLSTLAIVASRHDPRAVRAALELYLDTEAISPGMASREPLSATSVIGT